MKKWVLVAQLWVVGVLVATWSGVGATAPPAKPFPDSGPGRVAAAWFAAFNGGDDAARAFFQKEFTSEALARRSVEERLEVWKSLRSEHGALTPLDITGAGATSLTVAARAERGAELSMRFEFDDAPPHRFRGVRIEAREPGEDGVAAGPSMTEAKVVEALGAFADSLARA
ncbi:MAG TPA: hypothetical protein VFM17_04910, partial [Candidatus Eisenbacteria bacterium]|nr:hypothetical protein [Candidatus Eisenbacteria bacterium]